MHDSLDIIFDIVEKKEEIIRHKVTIGGSQYYRIENDPFRLYQSYLSLVQPIDVKKDYSFYKEQISEL